MMRKRTSVGPALGPFARVGKTPARADEPKAAGEAPTGKGERARDVIAAFNGGDAKAVVAFWMADAEYTDQSGRQTKGRAAIEKRYEQVFAARKGAKLSIIVGFAKLAIRPGIAHHPVNPVNCETPSERSTS
jgi:hypothetical protein